MELVAEPHFDHRAVQLLEEFCRTEEAETFRKLFDLTAPRLLPLLRLLLQQHGCSWDPSELLEDTFAQVFRRRSTFAGRGQSSFLRWYLVIAQNLIRQRFRDEDRRGRRELQCARHERDESANPLEVLTREEAQARAMRTFEELRRAVFRAIAKLPVGQKQVLLLHTLHHLRYRDIASRLGISPSAVAMRMKRARERILDTLTAMPGEDEETPGTPKGRSS
jgi:RNA polymerase sigma-70 factor (ECF subfamily)